MWSSGTLRMGIACVLLLIGGISEAADVCLKEHSVQVRLGIYSGRIGPIWTVTDVAQLSVLQKLLKNLPEAERPQEVEYLGFGSIRVRPVTDCSSGRQGDLDIWGNVMGISYGNTLIYVEDAHGLKRWILDNARWQNEVDGTTIHLDEDQRKWLGSRQ